jgi:hypothetical protein
VQAFYVHTPTEAELAGTGFTPEDYITDDFEVWPENIQAINLFISLQTQWIVGAAGPTGLNYIPLFARMDRMKLSEQEYEWMFDDIRVIEAEALAAFKAINTKD